MQSLAPVSIHIHAVLCWYHDGGPLTSSVFLDPRECLSQAAGLLSAARPGTMLTLFCNDYACGHYVEWAAKASGAVSSDTLATNGARDAKWQGIKRAMRAA